MIFPIGKRLFSAQVRKRFYKNVGIVSSGTDVRGEDSYEICLDRRKLRTPQRKILQIPGEALALAVGQEWESQEEKIDMNRMHLTGLSMTATDNPMKMSKQSLVEDLLERLRTDTVFFVQPDSKQLRRLQDNHWGNLINWAREEYGLEIESTASLVAPEIADETLQRLKGHLLSYNFWSLVGYQFGVEAVKSLIIAMATIACKLSVEDAVKLSLLESEFQAKSWGRVEWAHDVEFYEISSRLAAAVLFVRLNSTSRRITVIREQHEKDTTELKKTVP